MDGLIGIVSRSGRPVPTACAQAMIAAHGPAPFRRVVWTADVVLAQTAGSMGDGKAGASPGQLIAAAARLDDRASLRGLLKTTAESRLCDAGLLALAVRVLSERALEQLSGDWCFAAWDSLERRLWLARDQVGMAGLYYTIEADYVFFSTTLRSLMAATAVPRQLDEDYLARILAAVPRITDATAFARVKRLMPGHHLVVTPERHHITCYWEPGTAPDERLTTRDCVDGFRAAMAAAVQSRVAATADTGVLLSGGLDSGTVAFFAASEARRQGHQLRAYSHVPAYPDRMSFANGDERPRILSNVRAAAIESARLLSSASISPLEGIRRTLDALVAPVHTAGTGFWIDDLLTTSREDGITHVLNGTGGNATISWSGERMRIGFPGGLTPAGLRFNLRMSRGSMARRLWSYWVQRRLRRFSTMHDDLARRTGVRALIPLRTEGWASSDHWRRQRLRMPASAMSERGLGLGISVLDPSLDLRVVRFCLSVPHREYSNNTGQSRLLLRNAMRGLLEPAVLDDRNKGRQSSDLVARFRAHPAEIEAILKSRSFDAAVAGFVDAVRLRELWRIMINSLQPRATGTHAVHFARGLMIGLFLQRETDRCRTW